MPESYRITTAGGDTITTAGGDRIITAGTGATTSAVSRSRSKYNFWGKYKYFYELRPKAKARRKR